MNNRIRTKKEERYEQRIFALLLALVMVISPVRGFAAGEEQFADGFHYKIVSDAAVITNYNGSATAGKGTELMIPAELGGYPVKEIAPDAFSGCIELASVTVPDSVTSIGYTAFKDCRKLKQVNIPAGQTTLETQLFSGCGSLTEVTIPEGCTSIGNHAFQGCTGLNSLTLPKGLETTGIYAFQDCEKLETVTIPASVRKIDFHAFGSCSKLTEIKFCGDTPEMGLTATPFFGVKATAYYPKDNLTWTEDAMKKCGGKLTWVPYGGLPFTDVPADSYYYDSVLWAVEQGITNGLTATEFGPDAICNRAQVVTFLYRAYSE